jgi:hypothetical protein
MEEALLHELLQSRSPLGGSLLKTLMTSSEKRASKEEEEEREEEDYLHEEDEDVYNLCILSLTMLLRCKQRRQSTLEFYKNLRAFHSKQKKLAFRWSFNEVCNTTATSFTRVINSTSVIY